MNYIQQAYKGDNALWKVVLTTLIVSGVFIFNFLFYLITPKAEMESAFKALKEIPSNVSLVINLVPFLILLGVLFFLVKYLHNRSILSLTTSKSSIKWGRFFFSFSLIVTISLVSFAVSYYMDPSEIELQFNPLNFAVLFVISIFLFPFQIGFEEYLFRGYLMQQIGIIAKNRWVPLLATSLFFGLAHSANPEVAEMGLITMVFYIGTGLLLGIMTLMDERLELALGFHLGNNLLAALLITSDWSALQTDAVFRYTATEASNTAIEIILPVIILYPIILFILSKKYKWENWKEKLFGKIEHTLPKPTTKTINNDA